MDFKLEIPTALVYFRSLVHSDAGFPLLEAAASLAQDDYPELDIQQVLGDMDQVQSRLKRRLAREVDDLEKLRVLNRFFYGDLGFSGNVNDYYDPDNSFLNVVLRTRRGIPISLAVLWLELAAAVGLRAQGVGFPGHFLVKVQLPEPHQGQVILDPFTGESLSREDLLERMQPLRTPAGLPRSLSAPDDLLMHYLRAATPREIIARMLRNLQEIYRAQGDAPRLKAVQDRLDILLPEAGELSRP
jgi:regulator of sirC expression with transglutaminase-like and TPR domain